MNAFDLLAVSYHSADGYREPAAILAESCKTHGLPLASLEVPPFESWDAATHWKADFLTHARKIWPGRSLLYLDADAVVEQNPIPYLMELHSVGPFDIGVHYLRDSELLSGTIILMPTPRVDMVLSRWRKRCRVDPTTFDQCHLRYAITDVAEWQPAMNDRRLPPQWCWIDGGKKPDISEHHYGPEDGVIIRQTQASRRLKRRPA